MNTTSTTTPRTRAKRYVRSKNPSNYQFTKRRLEVNAEICRAGAIRLDHLANLFPDFPLDAFYRTNHLAFDNEFINRPGAQEELHRIVPGRLPTYITSDRWGVKLHRTFFSDPVAYPKYTYQNNPITRASLKRLLEQGHLSPEQYIKHVRSLEVSAGHLIHDVNKTKTLLDYRLGARTENIEFLNEPELWINYAPNDELNVPAHDIDQLPKLRAHDFKHRPPASPTRPKASIPLELKSQIEWGVKLPGHSTLQTMKIPVSTRPDGYFAHRKNGQLKPFFLEHDEGNETILPGRDLRQSLYLFREPSLYQKIVIYNAAYHHRAHVHKFGVTSFKVIIVTTTQERADNIVDGLGDQLLPLGIKPNFVLVTDQETLAKHDNNPYRSDYIHLNLAGDYVHLLDV